MLTLKNHNCLDGLKDIPENTIDLVLADLPFGTTRNKWDTVIDLPALWSQLNRVCRQSAAMLFFAQQPFTTVLGSSNLQNLRYEFTWIKNNATGFLNCKKMPLKNTETIMVFYRSLPVYNPQFTAGKPYKCNRTVGSSNYGKQSKHSPTINTGFRYPNTVLNFPCERGRHPTQKPVPLLKWLIKTYTNPGDMVLDPTAGSGSSAVAAASCGRNWIGFETDANYCAVARERLDEIENVDQISHGC